MLEDQLVVADVVLHPVEQDTGHLLLRGHAERPVPTGDDDVGGLAPEVLRRGGAAHSTVEGLATVAAADLDGHLESLPRGFETAHAEVAQSLDMAFQRDVRYLQPLRRLGA